MTNFKWFIILVFFFLACNSPKEKEETVQNLAFELDSQTISFQLPEGWGHFNLGFRNTTDKVYFFNHGKFSLVAYDKESQEQIFLIDFEKDGPNGIGGQVFDFMIDDDESIWLYASNDHLYQMSKEGLILKDIALDTSGLVEDNIAITAYNFQLIGSKFYTPSFPMIFKYNDLSVEEISALPNLIAYNLEDHSYEKLSFFDKEYLGDNLNKFIMPSIGRGKNDEMIINHHYKDIFVYHNGEVARKEASYSKFSPNPPASNRDIFEDMDEIMRLINYSDSYEKIEFLLSQNLYIRIAKFEETPDADAMRSYVASNWVLVFLDEDFGKIGEFVLPEKAANGNYIFDTKEGIWFSTDHPDNVDLDEDKMQFQLISKK
ncbi:DUF4221 domain-containing protein [Belliella sp. DSM 107340]|uniref:DUF4221 domain-containing protein n=1 Tax=Belliella calami TaxID=2923436 RepID=A0ABS9UQC1_9BACT|nr:DUF4221 family protein [Belliella calami]MCH7398380.1 DUF4221 domain-containing protein [Belliella calami]